MIKVFIFSPFTDTQMSPTLWVGTSLGSVIQVMLVIPPLEGRLSNPAQVTPSGMCN